MLDIENIEEKFSHALNSNEWSQLSENFKSSSEVYLVANGGLHYVAAHAAADCSRLIPEKVVYSFDSAGHITSCANDFGYENLFVKWLQDSGPNKSPEGQAMVIGMSCSGNSKNVTRALSWANSKKHNTFLISGTPSRRLERGLGELVLDCKYFHTCEVLTLMLFYQLIEEMGYSCPLIAEEISRKDPWTISA